jgi:tRNA-intron endonuclease
LIVKSGFKYGTDFRVYERSMNEHSRYLVQVMNRGESMLQLSRAIRVAHGVRKTLLLAKEIDSRVSYVAVRWIRP